jgi:hypothetical protein
MLLSYKPAFLFIHIDKAAGSSIQLALKDYASPRTNRRVLRRLVWLGSLNRLGLYRSIEFPEHVSAKTVRSCLPSEIYAEMFKFAFVRNPWDRLVSRYSYLLKNEKHPRHHLVKAMKGFDEYVRWEIGRGSRTFQYPFVADSAGKLIVDFVGYFERLNEDFTKICGRLGVAAELPRANASSHRDYRTFYTPELRDLVGREFQRDVQLFGYTFDGLAEGRSPQGLAKSQA